MIMISQRRTVGLFFNLLNIKRYIGTVQRPGQIFALEGRQADTTGHTRIVNRIYQDLAVAEKPEFFHALLLAGIEILLMRLTQSCKHTDCRLNHGLQGIHLARQRNAGLKNAQFRTLRQGPD